MAEKRMFAKSITNSDAFLDMPSSTQCLYFHLSMNADDDGFINKPKSIMRMVGAKEDDLKILVAKAFIIPFDDGVVVIKHWRINNYIQRDRYTPTQYQEHLEKLGIKENKSYTLDPTYTQISIEECSEVEDKKEIKSVKKFVPPTIEEVDAYIKEKGYSFDAETFVAFYESKGWKVGNQPMKNWRSACTTWSKQSKTSGKQKKEMPKPDWYDKHKQEVDNNLSQKTQELSEEEIKKILDEAEDLF